MDSDKAKSDNTNDAKMMASTNTLYSTHAASVQLPEFIIKHPKLWFIQVEAQFDNARITSEKSKYNYILSRLPPDVLIQCEDVIPESFSAGTLDTLKQTLIKRFSPSSDQRIREVLDNIQFTPPELPSAFFRRLWSMAGDALTYDVVLQRFRERLPANIANTIAALTNNLSSIYKTTQTRPVNEESIMLEVADSIQPLATVSAINKQQPNRINRRIDRRTRSASRRRSPSSRRYRESGAWCRNHFLYREKANKCGRPGSCSFTPRMQSGN